MVNNNFFRNLDKTYSALTEKLGNFQMQNNDRILILEQRIIVLDEELRRLRSKIQKHQFTSMAEEIYFFRNVKPKFMALYLYNSIWLEVESKKPYCGKNNVIRFYEKWIRKINAYFQRNRDFYNYWKRGATYLDQKYFVRNSYDLKLHLPYHLYNFDENFTTAYDHQIAMFLANEEVIRDLQSAIESAKLDQQKKEEVRQQLQWTAPKAALAELIYALYHYRCFNAGRSDLIDVVRIFENLLDIDLKNFHKMINEIKSRKINRTKFLQELDLTLQKTFLHADE